MATMSPLLIPTDAATPLVTPPRSFALPSDAAKLPDGAVPRVSEDDIRPPYASDAGELAQVKRDLRNAMRRADRAEADCAAARADCGEMQTRLRAAEKRAAASKAAGSCLDETSSISPS